MYYAAKLHRYFIKHNKNSLSINIKYRFQGKQREANAFYIHSGNGQRIEHTDKQQAIALLRQSMGNDIDVKKTRLITRFGQGYDFRNKRLPVWRIDINDKALTHVFVDPITGILVDQSRQVDRWESRTFSLLHKWNYLQPLIGRQWRDVLIVVTLLACLLSSALGVLVYLQKRARTTKH